jgi:hypothetical protein
LDFESCSLSSSISRIEETEEGGQNRCVKRALSTLVEPGDDSHTLIEGDNQVTQATEAVDL